MFSVNNFYDYLRHCYDWPAKMYGLRSYQTHGECDLKNLCETEPPPGPYRFYGICDLFDQEPIYFDRIVTNTIANFNLDYQSCNHIYSELSPEEYIFRYASAVFCPIVAHSEKNSSEIDLFRENFYEDVHYWYHGLIARDWFRHWKHFNQIPSESKLRFGLYSRDGSDDRSYRIDLLKSLIHISKDVYFQWQPLIKEQSPNDILYYWEDSKETFNGDASAKITWDDHNKFDIHIVAETVFDDTQKVHLTEKIFKPIVMYQPFILFANPGSLEYLKSYGFKTFDNFWNEDYDNVLNKNDRFKSVLSVINSLSDLSKKEFTKLMLDIQPIVEYNRSHFYSINFEDILLKELHQNFEHAFNIQYEKFYTMPGGTLFYYYNKLNNMGLDITDYGRNKLKSVVEYMNPMYPDVTKQIVKKYNHLF